MVAGRIPTEPNDDPMIPLDSSEFECLRAFLAAASPVTARSIDHGAAPLTAERVRDIEKVLAPESTREERLALFDSIVHDEDALAYVAARLRGLPPELALSEKN